MQHSVLKLSVDTLSIFFNLQEAVTQNPCFKTPVCILHFLKLYCDADLPSVG